MHICGPGPGEAENPLDVPLEHPPPDHDLDEALEPDLDDEGWQSAESDAEDGDEENSDPTHVQGIRGHDRPEYAELSALGLTTRPSGCSLGVHDTLHCWRSIAPGSPRYNRTWGGLTGRTPRQALLRVIIMMLEFYCKGNPSDRLAAKQLQRCEVEWAKDPGLL